VEPLSASQARGVVGFFEAALASLEALGDRLVGAEAPALERERRGGGPAHYQVVQLGCAVQAAAAVLREGRPAADGLAGLVDDVAPGSGEGAA
jgi:hypothetical protein